MSDSSKEQLHSAITAKAELDRTVSRLIIEDVTSIMAKNLATLLDAMERQDRARADEAGRMMALLEVSADDIKKYAGTVALLVERVNRKRAELDELQAWRAVVNARLDALEAQYGDGE